MWLSLTTFARRCLPVNLSFPSTPLTEAFWVTLTVAEVLEAVSNAEAIEDYPDDKYGPSCLSLGFTEAGRPLHLQCSYPSRPLVKVITLYEPDPSLWVDFRVRR
jgi:hypothetical protein